MTDQEEALANDLLAVLPLITRIVAAEVRREAGESTTMPQFRVLSYLHATPLTLSALAKQRRVSVQAMSELVQMLVERGWVTRTPDLRDRRQQQLQLTARGRQHYEQAHQQTIRQLAPLLRGLDQQELLAVQQALPALRRVLMREESDTSVGS